MNRFDQALLHAAVACQRKLVVDWIASPDLEETTEKEVCFAIMFLPSAPFCCKAFLLFYLNLMAFLYDNVCFLAQAPEVHKKAWDLLKVSRL